MHTLPLAPLPRETSEESNAFRRIGSEGFIDEQAVARVIARGAYDRTSVQPDGVALSACGDDYAGWMLPVKSPFRRMADTQMAAAPPRLPLPPALRTCAEPGIDPAYQGGHRWWLFGMAGAMTCGLIAVTLFSLAPQQNITGLAISPAAGKGETQAASRERLPDFPPSLSSVLSGER